MSSVLSTSFYTFKGDYFWVNMLTPYELFPLVYMHFLNSNLGSKIDFVFKHWIFIVVDLLL